MGFEGSVLAMINSLKNNEKLLAKRKTFRDRKNEYRYKIGTALKYKELPEVELQELKAKIRSKLKKQRRIKFIATSFIIGLLVYFTMIIFSGINDKSIAKQDREIRQRKEYLELQAKKDANRKEKRIIYYLNKGYSCLANSEYRDAKYYFYKAKCHDNSDYRVLLGYTKAYVYDCVYNEKECEGVVEILVKLQGQFGTNPEITDLFELYNERKT